MTDRPGKHRRVGWLSGLGVTEIDLGEPQIPRPVALAAWQQIRTLIVRMGA